MRAVVQRVCKAAVLVDQEPIATIGPGLLAYVGVAVDDTEEDARMLADKIRYLRCFPDAKKPLNRDVKEVEGAVLLVSAFTVQADTHRGRRPAFDQAASAKVAGPLYEFLCDALARTGLDVRRGRFGAEMQIQSTNDGPVCILLDSKRVV
ncbi:MAG: D-tyrosyl-tRNA(Tyr) deacylase [Planctomycetes bacterium]|nr:D-tyrosyl-tRNA(Tyr) deacylase [Planctomycetota bacterium]